MTTAEEILTRFRSNVRKKQAERIEKSDHKDKDKLHVTDICRFSTYCPRELYYDKVVNWPPTIEKQLKFNFGHDLHEIPVNENETEIQFEYEDIVCRMDDICVAEGWIADKKSVGTLPSKPGEYVCRQLNLYKLIAEENKEKPFKVNSLWVVYVSVFDGSNIVLPVPVWNNATTKAFLNAVRNDIYRVVANHELPPLTKGWWCKHCQYKDLCSRNACDATNEASQQLNTVEEKPTQNMCVVSVGKH